MLPPPSGSRTDVWLLRAISASEIRRLVFASRSCHALSTLGLGGPAKGLSSKSVYVMGMYEMDILSIALWRLVQGSMEYIFREFTV